MADIIERITLFPLFAAFILFVVCLATKAESLKRKASIRSGMLEKSFSRYTTAGNSYLKLAFFCMWFLFVAVGERMGADSSEYKMLFLTSVEHFSYYMSSDMEPFFFIFNASIRLFTDNFYIYKAICGLIMFAPFYSVVKYFKNKINLPFVLFAFVVGPYFMAFNIIRLFMASGLFLLGIKYLYEKKYVGYFLFALLGFLFHYSMVIGIFFSLLIKPIEKKPLQFMALGVACVILGAVSLQLLLQTVALERYRGYLAFDLSGGFRFAVMTPLLLPLYFFFSIQRKKEKSREQQLYSAFAVFHTIILISALFSGVIDRAAVYYSVPGIVFLSSVIEQLYKTKANRRFYYGMSAAWYALWFLYYYFGTAYEYMFRWR
ncbi:MAG: EpsG family protein [Firmicutes bacterium]|nr:EpsG family protein [Bacillota bacterium]